ncbi:MAG: hypothetical protein CME65_10865 [Halobacteriovoraceae bacterium]|nr:hypothetical protein [Halobacteriovoraceae bacterium]|tara:strand:+ start:17010 stop:17795 length:786 start_codon:yes stop_codon:yes gene_type:complete
MKNLWRNSLVILTLTSVSFVTQAQVHGELYFVDYEQQIQNKIIEVSQIMARLERALPNMRSGAQRQTNAKLDEVLSILNSRTSPRPIPGPAPIPGPRPGPGHGLVTVTGSIENTSFMFDVVDAADLATQCSEATNVGNVDDISISVNFGPAQRYHNSSSYWRGETEACIQIASKAIDLGVPPKQSHTYWAMGRIESSSFLFEGYSLRDIMVQCTEHYSNARLGNVDDIVVFDGSAINVEHNSSSYWRNSGDVCNIIIQNIR